MPEPCLLDNDIILKIAAYGLNLVALDLLSQEKQMPAMLGVGRYVVRQKASRASHFCKPNQVVEAVEALCERVQAIEPTREEIELAACLETSAQQLGVAFDVGEAQLFAVLLFRGSPALVTGDKRAITAASTMDIVGVEGRVVCLEQLLAGIANKVPTEVLRQQVCEEPNVDRSLSICFACASTNSTELDLQTLLAALTSYIADLRQRSGTLLMNDEDLSALAT